MTHFPPLSFSPPPPPPNIFNFRMTSFFLFSLLSFLLPSFSFSFSFSLSLISNSTSSTSSPSTSTSLTSSFPLLLYSCCSCVHYCTFNIIIPSSFSFSSLILCLRVLTCVSYFSCTKATSHNGSTGERKLVSNDRQ